MQPGAPIRNSVFVTCQRDANGNWRTGWWASLWNKGNNTYCSFGCLFYDSSSCLSSLYRVCFASPHSLFSSVSSMPCVFASKQKKNERKKNSPAEILNWKRKRIIFFFVLCVPSLSVSARSLPRFHFDKSQQFCSIGTNKQYRYLDKLQSEEEFQELLWYSCDGIYFPTFNFIVSASFSLCPCTGSIRSYLGEICCVYDKQQMGKRLDLDICRMICALFSHSVILVHLFDSR